ncbi:MAG: hypothetical protein R2762_24480 [Bryobacteraceae bacterium]
MQTGDSIRVRFTVPDRTTDGLPMASVEAVDLRFDEEPVAVTATEPGPIEVRVPLAPWVGKQIRIQVRVASDKGRWSENPAVVDLTAIAALAPPANVTAESDPRGLRLRWTAVPGGSVVVSRRNPATAQFDDVERVSGDTWVDSGAPYGTPQTYRVRATAPAGASWADSEFSPEIAFTPVDSFAPATPTKLAAVAGLNAIELAWEQSPEPDTAGYQVYRAGEEGEFERLGERTAAASYSDSKVESGKTYRYAVTAVDTAGNESARSEPLAATAP